LQVQMAETKWERFSDYLRQNKEMFKRCLTLLSLKNENMPLIEVINRLIQHEYMEGLVNSYATNLTQSVVMMNRD
jgi:hypothetical protein